MGVINKRSRCFCIPGSSVEFVHRSANEATHLPGKAANSLSDIKEWEIFPPLHYLIYWLKIQVKDPSK